MGWQLHQLSPQARRQVELQTARQAARSEAPILPAELPADRALRLTETAIQQQLVAWWDTIGHRLHHLPDPRLLMAFPLQGRRTPQNGARMKAEGMRAGTPDLLLAVPHLGCAGLWVELKTAIGRPTPAQVELLALLRAHRYATVVAHGFEAAQRAIATYLDPSRPPGDPFAPPPVREPDPLPPTLAPCSGKPPAVDAYNPGGRRPTTLSSHHG